MKLFDSKPSSKLPRDIRQLVDKGNFVIAIKELSSQKNISLEEAKALIDQYEADNSSDDTSQQKQDTESIPSEEQGFSKLTSSVTHAIESEGVSARVLPKWLLFVRRVLFVLVLAYLFSLLFEYLF